MPKWLWTRPGEAFDSGVNVANSNHRKEPSDRSRAQAAGSQKFLHLVILVLLTVGVFAGLAYLIQLEKQTAAPSGAAPVTQESVPEAKTEFEILKGRWVRPDGGYVVDIRKINASGKMTAAYFNPRPINVSRAETALDGTTIKVFIELRDINYPGATYKLTYDSGSDQLRGVYFQPALNQSFDVAFVRMK
jgi:hypothetical protein